MLDAPARLANFALVKRNSFECILVKIENCAVRPIADGVRLDLDTAAKRFLEDWFQIRFLLGEKSRGVRRITIRFQQRRATGAERAVENHFDCTLREMMIVGVDCRSFPQELLNIFAGPVNGVDKPQLHFSFIEAFANYFDVTGMAAGVLNFTPTETDLAIDSEQKCLFSFGLGWFRNVLRGQIHRVVEQHASRLASGFVL